MAWTSPKSWTVNEVVTAANMNTHLRDNLNWLANDHPRCQVNRVSSQTITTGTDTAISFAAALETFDVGGMHNDTNDTRLTVPTGGGGLYHITAYGEWAAGGTGSRLFKLRKNGTTVFWQVKDPVASGSLSIIQNIAGYSPLVATDYVELVVFHGQGADLGISDVHVVIQWMAF